MINAIILHGLADEEEYFSDKYPSGSNSHWLPWLQKQLLIKGIKADTPEVPRPFDFNYESWKREVERFDINENTILVGHSMGGGFWIRYLSEKQHLKIKRLILVAPWINPDKEYVNDFFDFEIDSLLTSRIDQIIIFNSDDDYAIIHDSVKIISEKLSTAKIKTFHSYGHFTFGRMKTSSFPELVEVLI